MNIGYFGWYHDKKYVKFEVKTIFDFFDIIGKRPGIFLGRKTLTGLQHFYDGYITGMSAHNINHAHFDDAFSCLVGHIMKKLNIDNSHKSWVGLILDKCNQDEEVAFDSFFEILAEFRLNNSDPTVFYEKSVPH